MESSLNRAEATNSKGAVMMLFSPREEGQALTEYALVLLLIALIVILVLAVVGPAVGNMYSSVVASFP
jgi:pilus assembly protein Flp/PilA